MKTDHLWKDGKIDFIKFVEVAAKLNNIPEKQAACELLDELGIKYTHIGEIKE